MLRNAFKIIGIGLVYMLCVQATAQEICTNGIDDDNDGLIDLQDPECACYYVDTSHVVNHIPNPSFEDTVYCPYDNGQMDAVVGWMQGNGATADYYNSCGHMQPALTAAGISASEGVGFAGGFCKPVWKEYIGCGLTAPFVAGQTYLLYMDVAMLGMTGQGEGCPMPAVPPTHISLFGSFTQSMSLMSITGCPTTQEMDGGGTGFSSWVFLGDVLYTPQPDWSTVIISFTPAQTVNAIMIGPPCDLPTEYEMISDVCLPYILYDNLRTGDLSLKNDKLNPIAAQVHDSGACGNKTWILTADSVAGAVYHWISPDSTEYTGNPLVISHADAGDEGMYSLYYASGSCTSEVSVVNVVSGTGNSGSVKLFNGITPNGDGLNDYLDGADMTPFCDYELIIWNRWGNEIFRQSTGEAPFRGKNALGTPVPTGVYFYILRVGNEYHRQTLTVSY